LNVMTWNSTGENAAKAAYLHNLIVNNPTVPGWMPDVIVIQEAQAAIGGDIWNMFTALGTPGSPQFDANYNGSAPLFAGIPGEGYILMHSVNVAPGAFAALNLAADPGVIAAIGAFPPAQQAQLQQAVATYRSPASAQLGFGGRIVELMTWHAELGPGLPFMLGVSAAVNYTAYFFLQSSDYYNNTLTQPGGANANLGLIPADLNATAIDLNNPTLVPAVPHLLPNWTAVSNNLDHIAARRDNGPGGINFQDAGHYDNPHSVHAVLVSTVHWP
ncbi:MAG: hypothetical protein AAFY88_00655, partial [Acidobacteriota bacterium]